MRWSYAAKAAAGLQTAIAPGPAVPDSPLTGSRGRVQSVSLAGGTGGVIGGGTYTAFVDPSLRISGRQHACAGDLGGKRVKLARRGQRIG